MKKAEMCSTHFILNCKLCNDEPSPAPLPLSEPAVIAPIVATIPIVYDGTVVPSLSAPVTPLTTVTNAEGRNVLSVADEYSIACQMVAELSKHLIDLEATVVGMKDKLAGAKARKTELKKKLLETLALGDDNSNE